MELLKLSKMRLASAMEEQIDKLMNSTPPLSRRDIIDNALVSTSEFDCIGGIYCLFCVDRRDRTLGKAIADDVGCLKG